MTAASEIADRGYDSSARTSGGARVGARLGLLRRRGKRVAAAAASLLVLAWLAAGGQPAASHAGLERSEPAAGAVLAGAPERVDAWFASALADNGRSVLAVSGPLGERVDDGAPRRDDDGAPRRDDDDPTHLSTGLRPGLAGGVYRVDWRGSAEDGHRSAGSFEFTIDPDAARDGGAASLPGGAAAVRIAAVGGAGVALAAAWITVRARRREA